jgi:hypothetical protein
MAGVTGREIKGWAFAKFATNSWGVAASVTKGTYFTSDGGMRFQPQRVNDEAFGQAFLGAGDLGDVTAPDLELGGRDYYDNHSYILEALAMGSPAAVTISTSADTQTTSWKHVIDLAPSIDGLGATFAMDKKLYTDELTSAKIYGFGMVVGDGGVMDQTFRVMGSKPTNISSVNINSTVHGANFPALSNRVFRLQGTFRMNVASGGSLVASDKVNIEGLTFEFTRPQDAPHVFGQDYVYEPADNGFPTVQLTLTYPRMSTVAANSLYQALRSDTDFKADLTFAGAYINSTDQYTKLLQFPALEMTTDGFATPFTGANQVKPTVTFAAKLSASSVSGMPFVNPFRLTRIMTNSTVAF